MATNNTAFEAPLSRFAWYSGKTINKYEPVIVNEDGYLEPATATNLTDTTMFIGVCQYGTDHEGDMVTVVKGAFPVVADGKIDAGTPIAVSDKTTEVNGFTYHTVTAGESMSDDATIGIALTSATAEGDLITIRVK